MPPRKLRIQLATQLDMKENQVYKWFWEVRSKQQQDGEAENISKHISELSDEQKFEVFINKSLKQYREQM